MMNAEKTNESCCSPEDTACCRVEALVSIDERGQMVLPKELREKAGILPGDKLAVSSWTKDGQVCCIFLTRAEDLAELVKVSLEPMMKDMAG